VKPFNLIPSYTSTSEQDFCKLVGEQRWHEIKQTLYERSSPVCAGCGHTTSKPSKLQPHLNWWDGTNWESAEFYLVCEGCHSIKHFDRAVANNWVVLCNSVYTQEEIIKMNRSSGQIKHAIETHKIIILKKTAEEYLNEIKESELNRNDKTKIIFGNKFSWFKE
jgi:hypothetical protein